MSHAHKEDTVRFTFDCPSKLHTMAKMKAAAFKQSLKDYFVSLIAKDIAEKPPKFLDNKHFKNELKKIIEDDEELMKKLANR